MYASVLDVATSGESFGRGISWESDLEPGLSLSVGLNDAYARSLSVDSSECYRFVRKQKCQKSKLFQGFTSRLSGSRLALHFCTASTFRGLNTMSEPTKKVVARPRPSLVAAAQSSSATNTPTHAGSSTQPQPSSSNPLPARMMNAVPAARPSSQARSTLSGSGTPTSSLPDQSSVTKMKFKPRVPIRRVIKQ